MSNTRQRMNRRLNISAAAPPPRRANRRVLVESPTRSGPVSPPSSCVSSDTNSDNQPGPETGTMVLAGCPRCLIYVMLSEDDPRCPNCKSTVLLNFVHDNNNTFYNINNANYYYTNNNANYYNNGFSRKTRNN